MLLIVGGIRQKYRTREKSLPDSSAILWGNPGPIHRLKKPMHRKPHLPQKVCPVCSRLFPWRKKWKKNWLAVIYCSERCRRSRDKRNAQS